MTFSDYADSGSFRFGEHDLYSEFGLRLVEVVGDALTPRLRPRKVIVPSRSGSYDYGARYYDERTVTLNCESTKRLTREGWRELSYILARKNRLYIFHEPEKYYIGQIYDPAQIETSRFELVRFELAFICEPFAHGETIQEDFGMRLDLSGDRAYRGTAATPTRIEILNAGSATATGIQVVLTVKR